MRQVINHLFHGIRFVIIHLIVFLLMACIARLTFLINLHPSFVTSGFITWMQSTWYGLSMDLSLAGYALIPAYLLRVLIPPQFKKPCLLGFYLLIGFAFVFANTVDIFLYNEWESRINTMAFFYYKHTQTSLQLLSLKELLTFILILVFSFSVFIVATYYVVLKFARNFFSTSPYRYNALIYKFFGFSMMLIVSLLFIRGGLGKSTMNHSRVFFSNQNLSNQAAVNPLWNAFFVALQYHEQRTLLKQVKERLAFPGLIQRDSLFSKTDPMKPSLTVKKDPNILFIILEGFSSEMLDSNSYWYMKGLSSLNEQGFDFSSVYAAGTRTDIGLCALFTGTPAPSGLSYLSDPQKIKCLPRALKTSQAMSYFSHFAYGGDINFANMRSLIKHIGFDSYSDQSDFKLTKSNSGSWGLHDAHLYGHIKQRIASDSLAKPWIMTALTLSSHAPYDVPGALKAEKKRSKVKRAYSYADSCLYDFVSWFSEHPENENTLLVITSDHGRNLYVENRHHLDPRKFHIPLILLGGALSPVYRAQSMDRIMGQTSILPWLFTNIEAINVTHIPFKFNRDPGINPDFAVYFHNNGVGMVTQDTFLVINEAKEAFINPTLLHDWSQFINIGTSYEHYVIKKYFGND